MEKFFINTALCPIASNPDVLVVYPHVPRTGGVTLRKRVLAEAYGEDKVYNRHYTPRAVRWSRLTEKELRGFRAYTDLDYCPDIGLRRPCLFIAMVRHPVYRVASLYHFIRRKPSHRDHALAMDFPMDEFYRRAAHRSPVYYDNMQTRWIAGRADAARALDVIQRKYIGVGLTNGLPDFVGALATVFEWPWIELEARGIDAERYDGQMSPAFREMVLRQNDQDMILFEAVARGIAAKERPVSESALITDLKRRAALLRARARRLLLGPGRMEGEAQEGGAT